MRMINHNSIVWWYTPGCHGSVWFNLLDLSLLDCFIYPRGVVIHHTYKHPHQIYSYYRFITLPARPSNSRKSYITMVCFDGNVDFCLETDFCYLFVATSYRALQNWWLRMYMLIICFFVTSLPMKFYLNLQFLHLKIIFASFKEH